MASFKFSNTKRDASKTLQGYNRFSTINEDELEEDLSRNIWRDCAITEGRGKTQYDRLREEIYKVESTFGESDIADLKDTRESGFCERIWQNLWENFPLGSTRTGLFPEGRRVFKYSTFSSRIIGMIGFVIFIGTTLYEFSQFGQSISF